MVLSSLKVVVMTSTCPKLSFRTQQDGHVVHEVFCPIHKKTRRIYDSQACLTTGLFFQREKAGKV
jgi:hypothetical protein